MRVFLVLTIGLFSIGAWADPTLDEVKVWEIQVGHMVDTHGRLKPELQDEILKMEQQFAGQPKTPAYFEFQFFVGRVGGRLSYMPILAPATKSFWMRAKHWLSNYQSTPQPPRHVKYLIIGGGLAGMGASKKFSEMYQAGELQDGDYLIIDKNGIAEGASGHNGGNRQPALERFITWYQSLFNEREKFIVKAFPWLNRDQFMDKADKQADQLLDHGVKNFDLVEKTIDDFQIDREALGVSNAGWMKLSNREFDEVALLDDVRRYNKVGLEAEMLLPFQVTEKTGLETPYQGKYAAKAGNIEPYLLITSVFAKMLQFGAKIFTQTKVTNIDWSTPKDQPVVIETNRGTILADKVIVAVDAWSSKLLPKQLYMVVPVQSHVFVFEHVPNTLNGMTITEWDGDLYYNGPKLMWYVDENGVKRTVLVVGGGPDQPMPDMDDPKMLEHSHQVVMEQIYDRIPALRNQPPSGGWTFGFGWTPDGAMIWGPLKYRENGVMIVEERIFIAGSGSQGYGQATQVRAGYGAAEYVSAKNYYDSVDVKIKYDSNNMFDMGRFYTEEYLFEHGISETGEPINCRAIF